ATATPAEDPRAAEWLDAERQAYLAAQGGDYATAISGWSALLDSPEALAHFHTQGGLTEGIAISLAAAHLRRGAEGDQAAAEQLAGTWHLEIVQQDPTPTARD